MALKILKDTPPEPPAAPAALNTQGYDTDKWPSLIRSYEEHFRPLVGRPVKMLEIGIFKGGSLKMWRDFFPQGTIVGLDMNPVRLDDDSGRIHIYQGLQQDTALLDRIRRETAPEGFDIIIDDGSHMGDPTRATFWHLFRHHLKAGGTYVVEDWGTGYWDSWPDGQRFEPGRNHAAGMVGFIKELVDECGMSAITHEKFGNPAIPARGSVITKLEVYPGYVFAMK